MKIKEDIEVNMTSFLYQELPLPRDGAQGQLPRRLEIDPYLSGKDTCSSTPKDPNLHGQVLAPFPRAAWHLREPISSAAATSSARVSPAMVRAKICIVFVVLCR